MKSTVLAGLILFVAGAMASHVPVHWTVDTSRVQPAVFDAYQGESLDLEVTMRSYGNVFEFSDAAARLYWQTNGMGSAWWSAPAEFKIGANGLPDGYKAEWTPEKDVGADVYNCFIGQASGNFRAEFRLRMRHSPGANPNTLDVPRPTIDFETVEVLNPPWITTRDVIGRAETVGTQDRWIDSDGVVRSVSSTFGEWEFNPPLDPWGEVPVAQINDYTGHWELNFVDDVATSTNSDSCATHIEFSSMFGMWTADRALSVTTNIVGRMALTNETMTAEETSTRLRILNDTYPGMRVSPPVTGNILPTNQFRALELGDDKTVATARYIEADRILVTSPDNLLFVSMREILQDGTTNFVLKSFQDYLAAVSPTAVNDLIGAYLPTNGGGTVTGELNVHGNMRVSGVLDVPSLLRVKTTDIEARGFSVSNGVLRATSGLVVSNGMCQVRSSAASVVSVAPQFHVDGGLDDVTFGGKWDNPVNRLGELIDRKISDSLMASGIESSATVGGNLGQSLGAVAAGAVNRLATLSDVLALAPLNASRPVVDRRLSATSNNGILSLRNNCVNVLQDVADCTGTVHVYFPLLGEDEAWNNWQRLHLAIYVTSDMAAQSIVWDYPAEEGGYSFRGETGAELSNLRAGDLVWFQQVGLHELAVRKMHYGAVIEVEQH